jgi:hypothetical protein
MQGHHHTRCPPSKWESLNAKFLSKGPGMLPLLEMSAPDHLSIGNSKELLKMTLTDGHMMCEKLSPPGLDARTMKELVAEPMLDAVQLPGTSPTESTDTSNLIRALKEIAEDKRTDWTEDHPQQDVQWKATNWTKDCPQWDIQWKANNWMSLLSIKSETKLQVHHGFFQGIAEEELFETQFHLFEAVFSWLHWSPKVVRLWSQSNWFLHIGKDSLDNYMALHLHLVTLCNMKG